MDRLLQEIIECEKTIRDIPLPILSEEDFVSFRDTGNRLVYEGEYFGRRKYLTVYAILVMHGKELPDYAFYVSRLCEVIEAVLCEKRWALPAHVDFKKYGTTEMDLTVDLFAAETAGTFAELAYRLSDVLPASLREKMVSEAKRRVLDEFSSKSPYSWWEYDRCNWSAVCAGNVGLTAIFIEKLSGESYEAAIARCAESMKYFLAGYEDDGTCTEGLGYYAYGMSYFVAFLDELLKSPVPLYKSLGEELLAIPKLKEIALFPQKMYMPGGISVAFSDGGERESYLPGLMAWMAAHFDGVVLPDESLARGFYEDNCYRYLTNERSIGVPVSGSSANALSEYLLPSAQWYVKSGKVFSFAAKGGHNDENHNHNDIGSFMLVSNGKQILCELGAGEYTKDYFTDKRYTILNNSSLGHNVPVIDGKEQGTGVDYRASRFTLENGYIKIEMHEAYEKGLVKCLERKLALEGDAFVLSDAFELSTAKSLKERFVCAEEPVVSDGVVSLEGVSLTFDGAGEIAVTKVNLTGHKGEALTYYLLDVEVIGKIFGLRVNY